jgi:hypothetical protein
MGTSLNVFITFVDVCVEGPTMTVEGSGIAVWSAKSFTFTTPPTDLVVPSPTGQPMDLSSAWMSPIVAANGAIDLFSVVDDPSRVGASLVKTAHLEPTTVITNPANYVGRPLIGPLGGSFPGRLLQFAAYPGATPQSTIYRAIGSRFVLGTATMSTATSLLGPWTDTGMAQLPNCPGTKGSFCWSLIGHPEMSSGDAVVVSYFAPATNRDFAHIVLIRLNPILTRS